MSSMVSLISNMWNLYSCHAALMATGVGPLKISRYPLVQKACCRRELNV
jgi:hypothetical protein